MTGHLRRSMSFLLVGVSALGALMCLPAGANADGPEGETFTPGSHMVKVTASADVESGTDGVHVRIAVTESAPGSDAAQSPGPAGPAGSEQSINSSSSAQTGGKSWADASGYHYRTPDGHTQDLTPAKLAGVSIGFWSPQFAAHPGAAPYVLSVDNQNVSLVWIPGSASTQLGPPTANDTGPAGDGGSHDPYQVARYLETHVPLPNVQVEANPGMGLVGLPSWFWVQGYTGQPFGASQTVTIPPAVPGAQPTSFTVSVRIWGDKYEWNFGDGSPGLTGSLGKAYPQESDVRHLYQFSSFTLPNGFPIQLTVQFAAQYQVNGGVPQGLPPIEHSYRTNLPVQQVQTTLSAPQRP